MYSGGVELQWDLTEGKVGGWAGDRPLAHSPWLPPEGASPEMALLSV